MRFLDLFAGIGGFRLGMEMAGHECMGHCEIDKFADRSYRAMHDVKESEWYAADIRTVRVCDIPRADVWCFGFPCQDISVAGKQVGFKGNRSGLFFTVTGLLGSIEKESRPKYLFIENVKNLLSVNRGYDFARLLVELDEIGYDAEWEVLNSKDFGVPQNRERVFIVGHLRGRSTRQIFPIERAATENACKIIVGGEQEPAGLYTNVSQNFASPPLTGLSRYLKANKHDAAVVLPVLTPDRTNKRQNGRWFKTDGEPMFTLTAQDRHGVAIFQKPHGYNKGGVHKNASALTSNSYQENNVLYQNCRIRRLTPRECFRLQGFPDEYFDRAAAVNSDSQLYKQAGNSVTVNVVFEIARRLRSEDMKA